MSFASRSRTLPDQTERPSPFCACRTVCATGVREVHASARVRTAAAADGMRFRRAGVFMGGEKANTAASEYERAHACERRVADIIQSASSSSSSSSSS
jgi:hypothetical protein